MPDLIPLTFRCVESKHKTDEHGRKSYSGLLSAVDEQGAHIDPRIGFPAKGTIHYAVNGELPAPDLVEGKCYRWALVEVADPAAKPEQAEQQPQATEPTPEAPAEPTAPTTEQPAAEPAATEPELGVPEGEQG